jgi:hypothetical protein
MMKIVTYVLIGVLVAVLGAAAAVYFLSFKPMADDLGRMKVMMPEFDKVKADLKKIRDKENSEHAWMAPAADMLTAGLADEIKADKAEVFISGDRVVANISEDALFMPDSHVFTPAGNQLRLKLYSLLKNDALKGKMITIGNTTESISALGRGKSKTQSKDARLLASERSHMLIKDFEKHDVNTDAMVSAAFAANKPEAGLKLKTKKTMLIIDSAFAMPAAPKQPAAAPATQTTTTSAATATAASAAATHPTATPAAQH